MTSLNGLARTEETYAKTMTDDKLNNKNSVTNKLTLS